MSHKLKSPVQTQLAVAVDGRICGDFCGARNMDAKQPVGRRRVFVQTESGCVLGMELESDDNVHTVKKRLQIALNFPTEESCLTFGDVVLKNDLSTVCSGSPLLLTRSNLHRSSSTPCLSPTGRDVQPRDHGTPIEILGSSCRFAQVKHLVKVCMDAISCGVDPAPVQNGLGGVYYFRNSQGDNVAIVKPTDEEPFAPNNPKGFVGKALGQPGLKRSVRVGETGFREVAAFLLDHDHFAKVPATALVKTTHPVFNINDRVGLSMTHNEALLSKIASFQEYIQHEFDASDHGTSSFPVSSVHRIGILDVRIFNTDRHAGNLLVRGVDSGGRFGQVDLIPIDHGLCLPEALEDPYFEWIHWPQSSIPFSEDELDYIERLDPHRDCEMLRMELPMIREGCLRVLVLCTVLLKEAAASGLCLAEIGEMMSRELRGGEEEPSELELLCAEARGFVMENEIPVSPVSDIIGDDFQFDIDCDEADECSSPIKTAGRAGCGTMDLLHCRLDNGLTKWDIVGEDEDKGLGERSGLFVHGHGLVVLPKNSVAASTTSAGENNCKSGCGATPGSCYFNSTSFGHRSANEQFAGAQSFVKLADMTENEWVLFMERFQELLSPALGRRRYSSSCQKQRQRLGISCQF